MRLIAAATAITLSVGPAYAGENTVGGDSPANTPFTKPPTQVTVTPSVVAQAPLPAGSLRKRS